MIRDIEGHRIQYPCGCSFLFKSHYELRDGESAGHWWIKFDTNDGLVIPCPTHTEAIILAEKPIDIKC